MTTDQLETELEERLEGWSAPGESAAEERGRRLATADFARRPAPTRRRFSLRIGLAALLTGAVAGLVLTPAGAKVGDLVSDAVHDDPPAPQVKLGGLPHLGPLLVRSKDAMWIVQPDGSRQSLGNYDDAVFSPHALYIAATSGRTLSALDPEGNVRWTIEGDDEIRGPAWSPSGFRVAYLDGSTVHVVAGDGTGDSEIPGDVYTPPAWQPPSPARLRSSIDGVGTHHLTYAGSGGRIHLIDTDSGEELWTSPATGEAPIRQLSWSADGSRLLVERTDGYSVLRRDGSLVVSVDGKRVRDVAISPDGSRIAAVAAHGRSRIVTVQGSGAGGQPVAEVFSGPGPITDLDWASHGRTLAIGWKATGEWIFIRPGGHANGVGDIAKEFDAPAGTFPRIEDWCCGG